MTVRDYDMEKRQRNIDAIDRLVEELAKSKQTKNPKLSKIDARVSVWQEHPKLVLAHRLASNQ